jgi:hypothetical protein
MKIIYHKILLIICLLFLLSGCQMVTSKCDIKTLLLGKENFPTDTTAEQLFSPIPEYPAESAGRSFYSAPDLVYHEVAKWPSIFAAKKEFNLQAKSAFDEDKYRGPWETPDTLFISLTADNYRVGCGNEDNIYQCRLVATYGMYSVFFRTWVSEEGITLSVVNDLLKIIDDRMNQCTK